MNFRDQKAVRSGKCKYLSIGGNEFLFDLAADPRERENMRYREPDRFEALKGDYAKWETSMPPIPEDSKASLVSGPAQTAKRREKNPAESPDGLWVGRSRSVIVLPQEARELSLRRVAATELVDFICRSHISVFALPRLCDGFFSVCAKWHTG